MKTAWKTLLPIALCLLLLLSSLSGCGPSEDPASSDPASTEASAEASTEDVTSEGDESSEETSADPGDVTDTSAENSAEESATSEPATSATTPDDGGDKQDIPANTTATKATASNVKESTVKVDGMTVHSATTPYVTGGQLPIRILMPYPQEAADMNKQAFAAHYEAISGMRVDYSFYIGSDIFVLTQTMMSSGNLPDIFMSVPVGFTCAKVSQYGKEGYFADLTNKLQTWAPNA